MNDVSLIKKAIKQCDRMIRALSMTLAEFNSVEHEGASNAVADINLQLHDSRTHLKEALAELEPKPAARNRAGEEGRS